MRRPTFKACSPLVSGQCHETAWGSDSNVPQRWGSRQDRGQNGRSSALLMEWWKVKRAFLVEVFRKSLFAPRWGGFASDFWVREGSIRTEVVRNSFWMRPVEGEGRVICESGVSTHLLWELSRRVDQHGQQCSDIKLLLAEILARLPDRSQ